MIIDFHAHVFPDSIAARTVATLAKTSNIPACGDGTIHDLLTHGIADYTVLAPVATKPGQWLGMLRAAQNPIPGTIPFGGIHPDDDIDEILPQIANTRLPGIKLHPYYQQHDADHPRMLEIYRKAKKFDLLVLIHAGLDAGFVGERASPEMFRRVAQEMDVSHIVLAHMGGWKSWTRTEILWDTPYLFDTSFSLHDLPKKHLERFREQYGVSRILFGTDWPWQTQQKSVADLQSFHLSEEEENAILGGNAIRLLGEKLTQYKRRER